MYPHMKYVMLVMGGENTNFSHTGAPSVANSKIYFCIMFIKRRGQKGENYKLSLYTALYNLHRKIYLKKYTDYRQEIQIHGQGEYFI